MSLILRVGGIRVGGALISAALTSAALISGTFISAFPIPGIFFHRPESLPQDSILEGFWNPYSKVLPAVPLGQAYSS